MAGWLEWCVATHRETGGTSEITVARIDKDNLTLLLFTFHVKVELCARARDLSYELRGGGDGGEVTKFGGFSKPI